MIRKWIKEFFHLYDYKDLRIGGHCGICGRWVKECIVEKEWAITICEQCKG
jgi:hypothetical protein